MGVKDYILISFQCCLSGKFITTVQRGAEGLEEISIWGDYGSNKIEAENYLLSHIPQAYILRPPYLYGPMQNVYREPFVFECALKKRSFYLPNDGKMLLQFFHVEDLCKLMETIIKKHPHDHIMKCWK